MDLHDDNVRRMNHWVAAIALTTEDSVRDARPSADGPESGETFFAFYLSLSRLVLKTVTDGDCGIVAMCLMLGLPQTLASRKKYATSVVCSRGLTLGTER